MGGISRGNGMKRYRKAVSESDEDSDLDEDERAALKAFKSEGFDKELAAQEAARLEQLDKEADLKRQREEIEEVKKRAEEVQLETERRKRQKDEALQQLAELKRDHASLRANSPKRRVVFVGNMVGASAATLKEEFKIFGTVVDVHIPKQKTDIGFVEFSASYEALNAVNCGHGKDLFGRPMKVSLAKHKTANISSGSDKFPGGAM